MKYPLQKELEKDLIECSEDAMMSINDEKSHQIALRYYNAIKRIIKICVDRNRY